MKSFLEFLTEDKALDKILDTKLLSDPKANLSDKVYMMKNIPGFKFLGQGSSRIAYRISYKGRDTVIKLVKTGSMKKAGIQQTTEELENLTDPELKKLGIFVPLIDYDRKNEKAPLWIHTEYASRFTNSSLQNETGLKNLENLMYYLSQSVFNIDYKEDLEDLEDDYDGDDTLFGKDIKIPKGDPLFSDFPPIVPNTTSFKLNSETYLKGAKADSKFLKNMVRFCYNYRPSLGDWDAPENWGVYNGKPVIIDAGFSVQLYKKFYQ